MLLCVCIGGSGFRANATTFFSLDAQLLSLLHAVDASLPLSLLYHLSWFPKSPSYHTHMRTHILALFQESWSITSWFWSHLTCLMGLSGETEGKKQKDTGDDLSTLISLCLFFSPFQPHFLLNLHPRLWSILGGRPKYADQTVKNRNR